MILSVPFLQQLKESFIEQLDETEQQAGDELDYADRRINFCQDFMEQLKELIQTGEFDDETSEVFFFKELKSFVLGRQIFYMKMYKMHARLLTGCASKEKEQLMDAVGKEISFLEEHYDLQAYHHTGMRHFDRLYFTRGAFDWKTCLDPFQYDSGFSTSADSTLAAVMASSDFIHYLGNLLHEPPLLAQTEAAKKKRKLKWACSRVDFVELVYALCIADCFSHTSIKEAMEVLSDAFGVDPGNFYKSFDQVKGRVKEVARFLRSLANTLERHVETAIG